MVKTRYIEICLLPPNATPVMQFLNKEKINVFKMLYWFGLKEKIVNAIDEGKELALVIIKKKKKKSLRQYT